MAALGSALPARMPPSSGDNVVYVNYQHGDNRNSGTAGSPKASIEGALDAASDGTVVRVQDGYKESLTNYAYAVQLIDRRFSPTNPVTIMADNEHAFKITTPSNYLHTPNFTIGMWVYRCQGIRIQGIRFSKIFGYTPGGTGSGGLYIDNSNRIEMYRCLWEDLGGGSYLFRGDANPASYNGGVCSNIWVLCNRWQPTGTTPVVRSQVTVGTDPTGRTDWIAGLDIDPNCIAKYEACGNHLIYGGGYHDPAPTTHGGVDGLVVANNIVAGTVNGGVFQIGQQCRNSFVVNNTIYGSKPGFFGVDNSGGHFESGYDMGGINCYTQPNPTDGTRNTVFKNNIVSNLDGHAFTCSTWNGPVVGNNVSKNMTYQTGNAYDPARGRAFDGDPNLDINPFFDTTRCFDTVGGNWTDTNPLFTAPATSASGDFSLQPNSPAVGVAEAEYCPTIDFNGNQRPAAPSLGAVEGTSVTPPPPPPPPGHAALHQQAYATLQTAALYKTWARSNPGEAAKLDAYWRNAGAPPLLKTAFGRAMVQEVTAYLAAAG